MQGPTITTRRCDGCGATAAYREAREDGLAEELCEGCARYRGGLYEGEMIAALEAIGFGIALARRRDLTDDQIRQAVELTLTDPELDEGYPVSLAVLGGGEEKWKRNLRPLDGQVTA